MLFWYLLLVFLFLNLTVSRWKRRHIIQMFKQLKSDIRAFPVIGQVYQMAMGGKVITDPELINLVSKRCLEKHYIMECFEPMLGNGSFIASVPTWRPRRKMTSQAFRQPILNQFVNKIFSQQSIVMTELLRQVDGKGTFSIWNYVNMYTFDSVFEGILGVQLRAQHNPYQPFLKAFDKCCELVIARIFKPWFHVTTIYKLLPQYKLLKENSKILNDFIDQKIKLKRMEMKLKEKKQQSNLDNFYSDNIVINQCELKPFLELLLESAEDDRPITDLECREELLVMALGATDTSAVGASFTAVMLSRYLDVQEKAYQELQEVFGESDRPVEADDLPRLNYLQAVIKETLRLYPPAPIVIRTAEKDIPLPSGITLTKGVGLCLHIWGTHRNPRYWGEDAEVFRPERFLDTPLKNPAAFIPFSFGPRNCPGYKYAMMSMTTLMATLLRRYQLLPATSADGKATPDLIEQPLRLKFNIMMKDVDGYKVQIKSRA